MPQSGEYSHHGPYQNLRFRIRWQGRLVAGFDKISALQETAVAEFREGVNRESRKIHSPGRSGAVTFEHGITCDTEFEQWANATSSHATGRKAGRSLEELRRDIHIEVYDEAGQAVLAYRVYRCWVSHFQALPDLAGGATAVAIQSLRLESEGWELLPKP